MIKYIISINNINQSCNIINEVKIIMKELKLGEYEHYSGKRYEVIGIARHSENLEELVIYKALYDSEEFGKNALWARPKSMFLETINIKNKKIPRFKYIK